MTGDFESIEEIPGNRCRLYVSQNLDQASGCLERHLTRKPNE